MCDEVLTPTTKEKKTENLTKYRQQYYKTHREKFIRKEYCQYCLCEYTTSSGHNDTKKHTHNKELGLPTKEELQQIEEYKKLEKQLNELQMKIKRR